MHSVTKKTSQLAQVQRSGEGPSFESPLIHFKYERFIVFIVLALTTPLLKTFHPLTEYLIRLQIFYYKFQSTTYSKTRL